MLFLHLAFSASYRHTKDLKVRHPLASAKENLSVTCSLLAGMVSESEPRRLPVQNVIDVNLGDDVARLAVQHGRLVAPLVDGFHTG